MFLLEILSIDKKSPPPDLTFVLPEIDIETLLNSALIWFVSGLMIFFFARLIFFIFKLAVAGTDEENIESAKVNIKSSIIFLVVSSISWVVISAFFQGLTINL